MSANPTVLVVQHDLDTPPAALEPPLAALGVRTVTWYALSQPEPPAGDFDGLMVLGGIVNPDGTDGDAPLERERELIADMHARGLPVLGICLGAQLVAQALGGEAERMPAGEIGWVRSSSTTRPRTTRCWPARRASSTSTSGTTTRARRRPAPPPRPQRRLRPGVPRRRDDLGPAVPRRGRRARCWRNGRRPAPTSSHGSAWAEAILGTAEQRDRAATARGAHRRSLRARRARGRRPRVGRRDRHLRSSGVETVRTTCPRDCYDACGVLVALEDGRIKHVRGDPDHHVSRGKLCRKCSIGYNGAFSIPSCG